MKNKKNRLALILVALVLFLGVGYAVVSSVNLSISGTASTFTKDLEVFFDGVTNTDVSGASRKDAAESPATVTATATEKSLTATLTVENLEKVGDTVTATYEIKNYETDVNATVTQGTITNSQSDYFTVTTDWTAARTINAGATDTVTVTVTLKKTPVVEANSTTDITIPFTAAPVAPTA